MAKLLLVHDDAEMRAELVRQLRSLGHEAIGMPGGPPSLETLRHAPFDLVLADVVAVERNDYELLEEVRADAILRTIPLVLLSSPEETESVLRAVERGAEDCLDPRGGLATFQRRLQACLDRKHLREREASLLRQLEAEQKRGDELLEVILPGNIAAELREHEGIQPRRFEQVGTLFADIVGFTEYCKQHRPEEVLRHLQGWVASFELLMLQHNLEKMKTVGDSFMATAGLVHPDPNPALSCVRCGLAMMAVAETVPPHWSIRVGLHVGPAIAGVVGDRKYQYDMWGESVSLAAHLTSEAEPGMICVNQATWKLLEPHCQGRLRKSVNIVGHGSQTLYAVEALKD